MRLRRKLKSALWLPEILFVMLTMATTGNASATYSFSDVNYPGAVLTSAQGINDPGQIVGYYFDTSGARHGFLLDGGTYTTIDCPSPYTTTEAFGINNLGQIVGYCAAPGGVNGVYGSTRSFILSGGVLTFLSDAPGSYGGASTFAQGINDSGQIVGWYADSCLCSGHGFLLSGGIYTTIGVPGFLSTYGRGINNHGEIVGGTQPNFGEGFEQGFTLNNGTYTNFNAPAAGANPGTEADGINDSGQSVGYYADSNNVTHGFLLDSGVFTNIDHPNAQVTQALGINSKGQLVGAYTDLANVTHGFVAVGPRYSVCLLYDPTKAVHSGATIPIKLQLCDGSGNDLSSSSIVANATRVTQISTTISGAVENAGNSNPDNNFRFDATLGSTGGYIFNLKTTGLSTGTYSLNFTVTGDSSVYAANFQVK